MKHTFFPTRLRLFLLALLLSTINYPLSTSLAQGTAFTYQGHLKQNGAPANGDYALQFTLYATSTGGGLVAGPITNAVTVSNGLFSVSLEFGLNFTGADRWLEIGVTTNGNGNFSTLVPRQKLTPTPYAILAQTVSTNGLAPGSYTNAVNLNNSANQFTGAFAGNGANMTNVNAAALGGFGANAFWQLNGNAGSTPGANFLGTADNLPMEFKVNGTRAFRLEPNPNAPNVLGGSAANEVTNGIYGAVIAGGGSSVYPNRVGAIFGTVIGGAANTASGNFSTAMGQFNSASGYASTAMGYSTAAGGFGSQAGGTTAKANHDGAFVWADNNFVDFGSTAANQFLIRAGGGVGINTNNANGAALAVNGNITVNNAIGTLGNQPLELKVNGTRALRLEPNNFGSPSVIGGSPYNFVFPGKVGVTIAGGGALIWFGTPATNTVGTHGDFATIGGGLGNLCDGASCTIAGGEYNTASAMNGATVGGGGSNTSSDSEATVGGGSGNISSRRAATVSGGSDNMSSGQYATVSGGENNTSSGQYATVGGGSQNTSSGQYATVGGGSQNTSSGLNGTVGGGTGNSSSASYATVSGGYSNTAGGQYSFAAGRQAKALHTGSFVWADSLGVDFSSTAPNQFLVRALGGVGIGTPNPAADLHLYSSHNPTTFRIQSTGTPGFGRIEFVSNPQGDPFEWRPGYIQSTDNGGFTGGLAFFVNGTGAPNAFGSAEVMRIVNGRVGIGTNSPQQALHVVGNILATGTITPNSDRNAKTDFAAVDNGSILERVSKLSIQQWRFKAETEGVKHIGPMAQDFQQAFGLGENPTAIATVDADGVALAAIQGLNQKLEQKETKIAELEQRLEKLERLISTQK